MKPNSTLWPHDKPTFQKCHFSKLKTSPIKIVAKQNFNTVEYYMPLLIFFNLTPL